MNTNAFFLKHKRVIIIVLVALIIIGTAYYFTLGKSNKPSGSESGSDSGSGSSGGSGSGSGAGSSASPSNGSVGSFPIKWEVYNGYALQLQKRINQSIAQCKTGSTIREDGYMGDKTVAALERSFPSIGANVRRTKVMQQSEYSIILGAKVNCV